MNASRRGYGRRAKQTVHFIGGIARVLDAFPDRIVNVKMDPGSPWVSIDVEPAWGQEATPENGEFKFAIWARSHDLYRCDEHGAVEDDPLPPEADLRVQPDPTSPRAA